MSARRATVGPVGEAVDREVDGVVELVGVDDARDEADPQRLVGVDEVTEQGQLLRLAHPDEPRQQPRPAEVDRQAHGARRWR